MPAELFQPDLPSTPVRRRASLLPISVATHVVIITAAVFGPLVAPGELPEPARPLLYAVTAIDLPAPPAVRRVPPAGQQVTTSPDKAPLEPPDEIRPEREIPPTSFGPTVGEDDLAGLPLGVPGGVTLPAPQPYEPPPAPRPAGPVRVGGQIETPRRLRSVAPVYPSIAQAARVEGSVTIEAVIAEDGRVREAKVVSGPPLLTEAALDAVKQWTFTPTRLNGQPVALILTVTVVFTLR